ncbi:MAG: methyltransferase family protein [Planctomycetota bacterium]|jgi:protein-S-isoprenylcysteine O-methyltransferase Ste14
MPTDRVAIPLSVIGMEIKNETLERFIKSFWFSALLFLVWGTLTVVRARGLWEHFTLTELIWVLYNGTISVFFLIRSSPSRVSMNPWHWLVALGTSFSGLFFERLLIERELWHKAITWVLIYGGLTMSAVAAFTLGRSYDLFPALRRVKTRRVYQWVRHPMYAASMLVRFGYLVRNPTLLNAILLIPVIWLYIKRAQYEEAILGDDPVYRDYARTVPFRFVPGVI